MTSPPLSALRVAVTMPPPHFFGGVDYNFAVEMAAELRRLGATVFEVEVEGFRRGDENHINQAVDALRSFAPDVAIGLPNGLYAFMCRDSRQCNVFAEVLEVPTLLLWDQGLLQWPRLCLQPLPASPAEACTGAIEQMRRLLNHPLYHHYSPDSGHTDALDRLGIISRERVRSFVQPAYPNFINFGYRQPPTATRRIRLAFVGNVYLEAAARLRCRRDPEVRALGQQVMEDKKQRLTESCWDLFAARMEMLPRSDRERLGLLPDSTFFWSFLQEEVEVFAQTEIRLHVLGSLKREYDFFGNFMEPNASGTLRRSPNIRLRRSLDYLTELPLLFMNSDVVVDIVGLGFNASVSTKIMGGLAAGGLVLFDYKPDFQAAMGEAGGMVMYRNEAELNTLVDRYLTDRRQRADIVRYLQHQASTVYSFAALSQRVLVDEPVWRQ